MDRRVTITVAAVEVHLLAHLAHRIVLKLIPVWLTPMQLVVIDAVTELP